MTDFVTPEYNLDGGGGQVLFHPSILGGGVLGVNTVRGHIQSEEWVALTSGWRVSGDGHAEFNDVMIRGDLESANYVAGVSGWKLRDTGDAEFNEGVFRGDLAAAGGTFSGNLSAVGGTFTGTLVGVNGTFSGTLSADQIVGGTLTGVTVQALDNSNTGVKLNSTTAKIEFLYGGIAQSSIYPTPSGVAMDGVLSLGQVSAMAYGPSPWGGQTFIDGGSIWLNAGTSIDGNLTAYGNITATGMLVSDPSLTSTATTDVTQNSVGQWRKRASSRRFKTNITPLTEQPEDIIMRLNPVRYDWDPTSGIEIENPDALHDVGFITEEVKELIPEGGSYDQNGQPLMYSTTAVLAHTVKALQHTIQRIEKLEGTNA